MRQSHCPRGQQITGPFADNRCPQNTPIARCHHFHHAAHIALGAGAIIFFKRPTQHFDGGIFIARLGFQANDLTDSLLETANRRVSGKRAVLASVSIGETVERDVAITFIDDDRLGGIMLLGMSFLGRYRFTIDDSKNRITLGPSR